jgi:hypothetical protein
VPALLGAAHKARPNRLNLPGYKFAATTGSILGDGSIWSPWTLQYGLDHVPAGETLYVRGGTYVGLFTATLDGTQESHRRTVRSYPGEWAILDSQFDWVTSPGSISDHTLRVMGDYWTVRDLELKNSNESMRVIPLGPTYTYPEGDRGSGLYIQGLFSQHINLVIHDQGNGVEWFGDAGAGPSDEAFAYGTVVYNSGWVGSSNGRGHGGNYYTQNPRGTGTKRFENLISTNAASTTFRCEGAAGYGDDCKVLRSTTANAYAPAAMSDLWPDTDGDFELTLGSEDHDVVNVFVDRVRVFERSGVVGGSFYIAGAGPYNGWNITNCDLRPGAVDGVLRAVNATGTVTVTGNVVFGDGTSPGNKVLAKLQTTTPTATWNNNSYYSKNATYTFVTHVPGLKNFATWKSETGFDASSTFTADTYPPDVSYVEPNTYETGRSHVTIYNQVARASTVSVSLTGTGLVNGDPYYIFNGMNPLAGAVASGTYSGASVSFPMTDAAAGTPADPAGDLPPGPSVFPDFGVFIVRKYPTMQRGV